MTSKPNDPATLAAPGVFGRFLATIGLGRPELRAWAMYDWANSAMMTTIVTAVFPIYFSEVAATNLPEGERSSYLAIVSTLAMVIIAVLSPILGALTDDRPIKKRMLGGFMIVGVVAVAAMFFIEKGNLRLAAFLFILANIGANGSFVFYDALLPHIARADEVDRVSTAAYALGYVGGGLLLALNLAWILNPGAFGLPTGTLPSRLAFVSVAIWWVVFSIPLFRTVREPAVDLEAIRHQGVNPVVAAFARLGETFRALKRYKQGFLMLMAFLVYNDGIGTIMRMAAIYGKEIGIKEGDLIKAVILVQFLGIPFAFLFGWLASKVGAKRSILFSLVVYTGISILARFMTTATHFYILAILVGMVQGGSQALSRSLFASLIPRNRSGEFFGFFAVVEKFAGIFGPLVFAISGYATGSGRHAILSVIAFFAVGAVLLMMVDVEAGQREALATTPAGDVGNRP